MDNVSSDIGYNSTTTGNLHAILNATIGLETYTKNSIEAAIATDAVSMDDLIAMNAEYRDSHSKAQGILRSMSGITSVISSSIFIWMIMRSHDRLSTTQHRLLLGLCISDILFSLSQSTFNSTAPSENDYMVWNAKGNQATCDAQGFIGFLGGFGGLFYNASLNLYFLSVVKYKKNEAFIRAKIEPFLHGVPITVNLSYSIYRLVKKHYNDDGGGTCIFGINSAPHCLGYDVGEIREGFEIPCWRGIDGVWIAVISQMVLIFIPVLIMIVCLGMIYNAVRTQEKRLARYGIGTLRSNLQQQSASTAQSSGMWGRISTSLTALSTSLKSRTWSCKSSNRPVTRSNNVQSQSRAVMHKAFGYTFAWFLCYGFFLIGLIILYAFGSFPPVLVYLATIFGPLQGLFNLLIFMYPRIVAAKKSKNKRQRGGETVSWCKAFSTAFWSRGNKGGKNQGRNRSNLRGGTSNGRQKKKTKNEDAASNIVASPMFGRIKKKKKTKRTDTPQEEEKCEIQVPDNLNPHKTQAMYSAASTATYAPNIAPSTDTTTIRTVADFEENANVGSTLSGIMEDQDEDVMLNQDEEEEVEGENADIVSVAADGLVSANSKEEKEIVMGNVREDEMKMDDGSE